MNTKLFYLENANPETADHLLSLLDSFGPEIDKAIGSKTGIEAWYKGFIASKAFALLSEEEKAWSFDSFQSMKFLLEELSLKVDDNLIKRDKTKRA